MVLFIKISLLVLLSLLVVFHSLILAKIIPYKVVWGSRLKTDKDMYRMEAFSTLIMIIFVIVMLHSIQFISLSFLENILPFIYWGMGIVFGVSGLGNALSKSRIEKLIFTPIAILLSGGALFLGIYYSFLV